MKQKGLVRVRVRGQRRKRDGSMDGDEEGERVRGMVKGDKGMVKGEVDGKGRKGGKLGTWRVEVEIEVRVRKGVWRWWAVGVVV